MIRNKIINFSQKKIKKKSYFISPLKKKKKMNE